MKKVFLCVIRCGTIGWQEQTWAARSNLWGLAKLTREAGSFVEQYQILVSGRRATTVAHILRDLGYVQGEARIGIANSGSSG